MVATSGDVLVSEEVIGIMKDVLFQNAEIITPNLAEAEVLSGVKINNEKDQVTAAKELLKLGSKHVLVKGGHLEGEIIKDILVTNDYEEHFEHKKVSTENTHGTGCTLASSIAAKLAQDIPMKTAVKESIDFVVSLLSASPKVGRGNGPLVHGVKLN
jgi:hydroxymethylpyrimidine/phosphomethylpyrimidine kinase